MNKTIPQIVQDKIMGNMVFFKDGIEMIALGNYALDFKHSYAFLGFTKNKSQVILGDIYSSGPIGIDGKVEIKYKKRYAKVEYRLTTKIKYTKGVNGEQTSTSYSVGEWRIHTDGFRYSETIMEVQV